MVITGKLAYEEHGGAGVYKWGLGGSRGHHLAEGIWTSRHPLAEPTTKKVLRVETNQHKLNLNSQLLITGKKNNF